MSILPGNPRTRADAPHAALVARNVRPVQPVSKPVPPGTVHPVLAKIVRDKPRHTTAMIDGRPVQVFIERDRLHWWKLAGLVAAVIVPLAGIIFAAIYATGALVSWIAAHAGVIVGALAVASVIGIALRGLLRAGVCCPGLHCSGCSHR